MDGWERIAYSMSRVFCIAAFKTLNYRWKVHGKENLPKGRAILAPNHVSYFDPIFLGICIGKLSFVARDLNHNNKFLNELFQQWLGLIGVITINREKPSKSDLTRILKRLEKGNKVVIFPEGTRSLDGKLGGFNDGVAHIAELSNSPIVPVAIKGTYELWPRHRKISYSGIVEMKVSEPLYLNKELSKYERRKDLTERIRISLEKSLNYS